MAFGSAWAWQLIKGWSLDVLLWWMANLRNEFWEPKFPRWSAVSHSQNKRNCGSTHRFAFEDLVARVGWEFLVSAATPRQRTALQEDSTRRHPLPDLGQPCVHVPAQSCFRAIQPTHRAVCGSDISPWSPLLDLGQAAQCSLHLLIPQVLEQFPPLPKDKVLKVVLWRSREQCQNEGSAKVALRDSWTRTWLDHQVCLSSEGKQEFHTAKLFLEPSNLCLTKTCSRKLKAAPSQVWRWQEELGSLTLGPANCLNISGTDQTQSQPVLHPIWGDNLILHLPLHKHTSTSHGKGSQNLCSTMTTGQPRLWSCSSQGQWALLPLNSIRAEMTLRFFQFRCQLLIWMMVIWFHGKSVESS